MRRKDIGRDLSLTVRLGVALTTILTFYVVAEAGLLIVFANAIFDRNFSAAAGAAMFAVAIPVILVRHARRADDFALRAARASVVSGDAARELRALLERVAAQANVPAPRLALIESQAENAFTVGTSPSRATVAITRGLLEHLTIEEIEAVVAHELSHVMNHDTAVMTFVSGPALVGEAMWHGSSGRGKLLFVLYLPVYVLGLLLMWSVSRYREYIADRGSAVITGAPEQLMSALAKIGRQVPKDDLRGGAAVSALCIVSVRPRRGLELLMDHPPLDKRLRRLAEIARDLGRPAGDLGRPIAK